MLDDRDAAVVQARLLANQPDFLAFLTRRLGDAALAEDVLQDALVKGLAKADTLRADETALAWFYRILRNAVVDHARRRGAQSRKLAAFAQELASQVPEEETERAACVCVRRLAEGLQPSYAEALRATAVEGLSMQEFAEKFGISSGNAAVRLFRARAALRGEVERTCGACAERGCLDCTCNA